MPEHVYKVYKRVNMITTFNVAKLRVNISSQCTKWVRQICNSMLQVEINSLC